CFNYQAPFRRPALNDTVDSSNSSRKERGQPCPRASITSAKYRADKAVHAPSRISRALNKPFSFVPYPVALAPQVGRMRQPRDIDLGDVVLLDNGAIQMKVLAKNGNKVECEVLTEGTLGSRRHINLPGVKVSLPALTAKDLADVEVGLQLGVDYIALSFVREAKDIQQLKSVIERGQHRPLIVAKIEDQQAVKNLAEIVA